jgi:transposase-like protein
MHSLLPLSRASGCIYTGLSTPAGATIDFLLSAKRDAAAAERFLAKALRRENHPVPRVINTDEHAGYPPAIVRLKAAEALEGELPASTGAVPK